MVMTKQETAVAAIVALLLLGGGAAYASSGKKGKTPTSSGGGPKPPLPPDQDGAALLKRANQKSALKWAGLFLDHPVTPLTAAALARWAGIESSGVPVGPNNPSRLDERGLMQAGPQSVAEGAMPAADWAALADAGTTDKRQADIAVSYVDWLASRAAKHLASDPTDPIDRVWFAKLYHQRPVDVRDVVGPLTKQLSTTDARSLAHVLASTWANDAKAMHRLRAANVVAWGTPTP